MNIKQAGQIAQLINERNQLVRRYTADVILAAKNNYLFELSETGDVTGCVEVKKVQWYQFEIDHLCVAKALEGKGVGWTLFKRAEQRAKQLRGRVLQCTIRNNDNDSKKLFTRNGFQQVSEFFYPDTGNNVGIWQKVISLKT